MIVVEAYAIVSADDRIADADRVLPPSLMNDADWRYFQAELDRCDITVLGRLSHDATPNRRNRTRVVMSSSARGLERRDDAWWWNAADLPWADAAARLLPNGGRVGVPGGRDAFDYFLDRGLTAFHLSRAHHATLPGGRGVFAAVEAGARADDVLAQKGFVAEPARVIDEKAGVTLTVWRRPFAMF